MSNNLTPIKKTVGFEPTEETGNEEENGLNIKYKKQDYGYDSLSASFEERMFNSDSNPMINRIKSPNTKQPENNEAKENANPQKEQNTKQQQKQQQQQKPNLNPEKKSQKQMTRAERRALQEKQRAAKAAAKAAAGGNKNASKKQNNNNASQESVNQVKPVPAQMRYDDPKKRNKAEKNKTINRTPAQKPVALFAHLTQYEKENDIVAELKAQGFIHPAVLILGLQFSEFIIDGGNARCIAMLNAFKKVISDYKTPTGTSLSRHLTSHISKQVEFLSNCRTLCGSMKTAIRYVKTEISKLSIDLPDEDAKSLLCELIDNFIRDRIYLADKIIITNGLKKIKENDVILTYSYSTIVSDLLLEAHQKQKINFSVVVVDSKPRYEGKLMLKKLVDAGIKCTYILLNGLSFMLHSVTKVIIGASSLLSNGAIMSRVGTAVINMMAYDFKIPVMVCCETYKFSESVRLDSFVWNEIGDPDELINNKIVNPLTQPPFIASRVPKEQSSDEILSDWRDIPQLKLLNLHYDVTPSKYITMVITEMGMIPSTSVPVVLREVTGMGMA
ncbi:hypothetical protein BCR36DRAFT_587563 [Piromyces finnis]|uniref:Translation initiation factor eIF2B subunit delta n=1 Tax=Piromyces finnis TaxID=1754191 RepID=A0A1Y1UVD8_9FUNG|nr:hypothetical protein BCR36DRAFT_587563 [Piromyces finnis]|eukprot:ORX41983.1 hypothetical protein BCR36DRAFT_587563 [Piromyces finnis]